MVAEVQYDRHYEQDLQMHQQMGEQILPRRLRLQMESADSISDELLISILKCSFVAVEGIHDQSTEVGEVEP